MATVIVTSILAVACAFMIYILVQFYIEAKRPRRAASHSPKGVIAFRKRLASRHDASDPYSKSKANGFVELHAKKKANLKTLLVLPAGIRRLAAKRAARR